jgi:hypothetical protein
MNQMILGSASIGGALSSDSKTKQVAAYWRDCIRLWPLLHQLYAYGGKKTGKLSFFVTYLLKVLSFVYSLKFFSKFLFEIACCVGNFLCGVLVFFVDRR